MKQLSFFQPPSLSVSELTHYLRQLLEGDETLQDVWVTGEVSNFSSPNSGHIYFTLKDSGSALKVVMWRNSVLRQRYVPRDGEAVEVHGSIGVYEANGVYQLYADLFRSAGEGLLHQQFLRLKAMLEAEGLFEPERKRPIPHWPNCIGVVTSSTGAALRDMLNTLQRRYPLARVVLAPTPVQGDEAPQSIVAALEAVCRVCQPDVILLARGGGSLEDLWAFNDERVARAILATTAPVICGVGHETDFTIADFTADLRAPTPTAAAELATPNLADIRLDLEEMNQRLVQAMHGRLESPRWELNDLRRRLEFQSPESRLRSDRQGLDESIRRIEVALAHTLTLRRARLHGLEQRLAALNPLAVLGRGYAVVHDEQGNVVHRMAQARPDEAITIRVSDGEFGARVDSREEA